MHAFRRPSLLAGAAFGALLVAVPTVIFSQPVAAGQNAVKAGVDAWQAGDYAGAIGIWRPLADAGDPDAQFNLAQAYRLGRGVPTDMKVAQGWYEKAARQGHEEAQTTLGLSLFQSGERARAMPWIQKSADRGDPRAQYFLGTALFNGDVVAKDWPRAYAMMQSAASQGFPPAASSLEQMDRYIPLAERQQGLALARKMDAMQTAQSGPPRVADRGSAPPVAPSTFSLPPSGDAAPTPAPVRRAAAPTPKRAAAAPSVAVGGRWRVQLGAFASSANARRAWDGLRARVRPLGSLQAQFVAAGAVTRLQAGPVPSRAEAERVCAAAKAAGAGCFPVAP